MGAKLFGFDNFFTWLITDPDFVHPIMDRLTDLAIRYAAAQVEADLKRGPKAEPPHHM